MRNNILYYNILQYIVTNILYWSGLTIQYIVLVGLRIQYIVLLVSDIAIYCIAGTSIAIYCTIYCK